MTQLHRRFTDDQIRVLLHGYSQGLLARSEIQGVLGIGKTRFFTLRKKDDELDVIDEVPLPPAI